MPLYTKTPEAGGTWRLRNAAGEPIGRIWQDVHIDRALRDGDLADAITLIMNLTGAARRSAARTAYNAWLTAGGHSVDFSALTTSLNNDAGVEDGNRHLYIAGNEFGYLHGVEPLRDARLARVVRLAEEVFGGEQLATSAQRNAALEAAIDRFRTAGATD